LQDVGLSNLRDVGPVHNVRVGSLADSPPVALQLHGDEGGNGHIEEFEGAPQATDATEQ
jgi:hypothetical protein